MGKWAITLLAIVAALLLSLKPLFNISPLALADAIDVAGGLGAKLACSGHYITGLSKRQIEHDLVSYSPAFDLIELDFDPADKTARADILYRSLIARYRPGLGCTLDLEGADRLDRLLVKPVSPSPGAWPAGNEAGPSVIPVQATADDILAQDIKKGYQTRALLVASDSRVVAESYAEGFDETTLHLGWSMAKSVTAILFGILERDGLVDPDRRALFAAWAGDGRRDITLENMLQMSSGLEFDEEYTPGSDATRMLFAAPSAAEVALHKPARHQPGEYFAYSSGTTNLLSLLFHQILGGDSQSALNYVHRRLFAPLGMAHSVIEPDPSGVLVGSSFMYASARDWARLGQLMLNEGMLNGHRILSADWVHRSRRPNPSRNEPRYGYQFWLNGGGNNRRWPDLPDDAFAMMGNRSQVVMMIPSRQTVIVRLGWSADGYPTSQRFASLLAALDRADGKGNAFR